MSIKAHIPNTITSLNLACGAAGVVCVGLGHPQAAFCLMLGGAVADFFDGLSARALGAYSPMGKELDSLADQVSFGVLPSVMLTAVMFGAIGPQNPLCWIPMLIAVFSGLRLAKFNIDTRQTSSFIGMPTPACAMVCGSLAYFVAACPDSALTALARGCWFIPVLSVLLSALLVCEIPMFSMKMHKGDRIGGRRIAFAAVLLAAAAAAIICKWNWSAIVLTAFTAYIIINVAAAAYSKIWKRK